MILSSYERMIVRRYLLPGRGEAFIALVASISLGAVMLGVAALISVMSIMNGFRADLIDKIVGLNGHAVVQGYNGRLPDWQAIVAAAKETPGITAATPMIDQPLMASNAGRVEPGLVRGLRVADIRNNALLRDNVVAGSLDNLRPGEDVVAIGSQLAQALGAQVGGTISLLSPEGQSTPFGTVPRIVSYRVGAIVEVGVYQYDQALVVMPLENAQTLLMTGDSVGQVEIDTVDAERVREIVAPLAARIGGAAVVADWQSMNSTMFEALAVERVAMFIVLSIIILVAVFNILSSLIMLVRAKRRDIAILRTMGATRGAMMRVFVTVGVTVGLLGTGAGLVLAFLFLQFRQSVVNLIQVVTGQNLWDPSIRILTELPSRTDPVDVIAVVGMALVFSFLATLYPAWKAANTDPVEVLRYE